MFRLLLSPRWLILLIIVYSSSILAQSLNIKGVRIWHAPDHSRIVFDISQKADYSISLLDKPSRYVVDFRGARNQGVIPSFVKNKRIKQLGMEVLSNNSFRYVIPLQKTLRIKSFQLSPNKLYGHRLVIDLFDISSVNEQPLSSAKSENKKTIVDRSTNPSEIRPSESSAQGSVASGPLIQSNSNAPINYAPTVQRKKQIIVAIDAGHGGEDPGALGSRSREKNVTLSIAKRLAKTINKNPQMRAVLIRTSDYFIRLRTRTNKARQAKADLFISIHADAALNKSAKGMSVFALSQRGASSELARSLARKENQADLVGGVSIKDKDDALAEVLLDLSMTNTISESVDLGSLVLRNLSKIGKLHSKRVEQAGFAVLKSPDIPSILVETGFITNRSEEKLLLTRNYQQRIAESIYQGIVLYVQRNPVQLSNANYNFTANDSTSRDFNSSNQQANQEFNQITQFHVVKSGDSLSKIAFRYGISLKQLKLWNNLKSNVAFKGQRLRVSSTNVVSNKTANQGQINGSDSQSSLIKYTVRGGDTLSGIAQKYGVTMASIRQRNKLKSNNVFIGQRLKIASNKIVKNNTTLTVHVVKAGEYLSGISKRYNISIKRIKSLNKLRNNNVYVGQKLRLTDQSTVSTGSSQQNVSKARSIKVIVKKGQTLSGLALKYKVKQVDIVRWNKLKKRELFIGQRLTINLKS